MTRSAKDSAPAGVTLIGVLLLAISIAIPAFFGGRSAWNSELASQFQQAAVNYHDAIHARAHQHARGESRVSFEDARTDYDRLQSQLESAQGGGQTAAAVFRWSGVCLLAAGIGLYFWMRSSAAR